MTEHIIPGWYKEKWAEQVIIKYQNRGYVLKGTTMEPVRIDGKKFHFLLSGEMEAQPYSRGDEVTGLNPEDDTVEIESSEWDAPFYLYDFDRTRIAAKEEDARQRQASAALGRYHDRVIYDAVMAANIPNENIFGDYGKPFDPYVFLTGLERLADADVDTAEGMVFAPLPSKAFYQLKTHKIWASADWIGPDLPLKKLVQHQTFDVANSFILPPHLRKRYTQSTQLRFRIWHKSAMGSGTNENLRTEWERQATKKRWFVNHTMDGVAKTLQPEGIIEFRMNAASAIDQQAELLIQEA